MHESKRRQRERERETETERETDRERQRERENLHACVQPAAPNQVSTLGLFEPEVPRQEP